MPMVCAMPVSIKKLQLPSTEDKKPDHQKSEDIARKALQNGMKSKCRRLSKDGFQVKK